MINKFHLIIKKKDETTKKNEERINLSYKIKLSCFRSIYLKSKLVKKFNK